MTSIFQGQPSKQGLFQAKQESVGFQCIPFLSNCVLSWGGPAAFNNPHIKLLSNKMA